MEIDWVKVSGIGTLLGAVATFTASFVSLYIANKAVKKKLVIKSSDAKVIVGLNDNKLYVSVDITNIGVRQVFISGVGYKSRKKAKFSFMNPSYTASGDITPFKPNLINPEEKFFYLLDRCKLIEYIRADSLKAKDVRLFCTDTTGKVYYCKFPKSFIAEVWPNNKK